MIRMYKFTMAALAGTLLWGGLAPTTATARDRIDFRDFLGRDNRWSAGDLLDIMDLAHLDRGQRDKIRWLVRRYDGKIRDVRRKDDWRPSRKVDRIYELQAELRRRIILVLDRDQRDALRDLLDRDRVPAGLFGEDVEEWKRAMDAVEGRD